jgi:hypothetical protein
VSSPARPTQGWRGWSRVILLALLPAPTTSTIGVIQEQLNLSADQTAEVMFAATHSVGTQKLTSDLNALYTSINPNWYLFHYQLATGHSMYAYIIQDNWGQDFDPTLGGFNANSPAGPGGVTSHEDWFEHSNGSLDPSTTGNRFISSDGLYLANIDNPDWRAYQLTSLVENMLATGAQGVFADTLPGPVFGYYTGEGDARFDYSGPIPGPANPGVWPNGETWLMKAANYMSYIQGELTAAGELQNGPGGGFVYMPNSGALNTGWADIDYSAAKGVFAEGFASFDDILDWGMAMNRALRITSTSDPNNADRLFLLETFPSQTPDTPEGLQERSWIFGSYLFLKGDHTYINMYGAPVDSRLAWYPEYQVNLGAAQDPGGMPLTIDGYYDPNSLLFIRYFANGIVLLNYSSIDQFYNPAQTMQQVIVNGYGGGVRDGDIDPTTNTYVAGWLTSQLVDSVTVGPFSSVILINQDVPIEVPPPGG